MSFKSLTNAVNNTRMQSSLRNFTPNISTFSIGVTILQTFLLGIPSYASNAQLPLERKLCKQKGEYAVFAQSRFDGSTNLNERGGMWDSINMEDAHEHIFFCKDGKIVDNIGFRLGRSSSDSFPVRGQGERFREDIKDDKNKNYTLIDNVRYNSKIIYSVLKDIPENETYCLIGNNCQNFAQKVREKYKERSQTSANSSQTFKTTINFLAKKNSQLPDRVSIYPYPTSAKDEDGYSISTTTYVSEKYKEQGVIILATVLATRVNPSAISFLFVNPTKGKPTLTTSNGFQLNFAQSSHGNISWYDSQDRLLGQKTITGGGLVTVRDTGIAKVQVGTLSYKNEALNFTSLSFTIPQKPSDQKRPVKKK